MPPQKMERHGSGERRFYSIEEMWWQAKKSKTTLFRRKSFGETRQRQPLHQHEGISVSTFEQIWYQHQFKNCLSITVQQSR